MKISGMVKTMTSRTGKDYHQLDGKYHHYHYGEGHYYFGWRRPSLMVKIITGWMVKI